MYSSKGTNIFSELNKCVDRSLLLRNDTGVFVSGFRMQRKNVFVLQKCDVEGCVLTGYSKSLERKVSVESIQARPLLNEKTVVGYLGSDLQKDRGFLILNDNLESPRLLDYLHECENVSGDFDGISSFRMLTPKRLKVVDSPKFIISTLSQRCKCFFDIDTHWTYTVGIYSIPKDALPAFLSINTGLAIYNSRLFSFYKMEFEKTHKKGNNIHYAAIASFPYPTHIDFRFRQTIDALVECLISDAKMNNSEVHLSEDRRTSYIQETIDMCVYELYFSEYMHELKLDVLEELACAPFIVNEKNKSERISEFYTWFMKSGNIVRQRIMLLDSRSPQFLGKIHSYYFK